MCGVSLFITSSSSDSNSSPNYNPIRKRGPDFFNQVTLHLKNNSNGEASNVATLSAAVLSLQRQNKNDVVKMPAILENSSSILLWNGEIFFGGAGGKADQSSSSSSDTLFVAQSLLEIEKQSFSNEVTSSSSYDDRKTLFFSRVASFFRNIGGPFAFVYVASSFSITSNHHDQPIIIICGRDVWGRRSLMLGKGGNDDSSLLVSSAVLPFANANMMMSLFKNRTDAAFLESLPRENLFASGGFHQNQPQADLSSASLEIICPNMIFEEIKPDGIYEISPFSFDFRLVSKYETITNDCQATKNINTSCPIRLHPLSEQARFQNHLAFLPMTSSSPQIRVLDDDANDDGKCIHDSFLSQVMEKTYTSFTSLLLGSDSSSQQNKILHESVVMNIVEWIADTTHWGPESFRTELIETMKKRYVPFVSQQINGNNCNLINLTSSFVYITFLAVAVHRRIASWNTHPNPNPNTSSSSSTNSDHSIRTLLILFSGGIDCVVLAKLAAILSDPQDVAIDLINVSFGKDSEIHCLSSVDRISCLDSVREILRVENDKTTTQNRIRLLLSDVSGEEIIQHSADIALALLPKNTVMDTCIGSALYFAARGEGRLANLNEIQSTTANLDTTIGDKIDAFSMTMTKNRNDDDDDQDENDSRSRFLPLLKCLIRHYVDRGVDEMSICLLGKEFTSPELMQVNEKFGYKSLRIQAEAAANAGLIGIRGETYHVVSTNHGNNSGLPQVRQRGDEKEDINDDIKQKQPQEKQQKQQCSSSGRNYFVTIKDQECLDFAQLLRQERLKIAGLSTSSSQQYCSSNARVIIAGMGADESLGGYHRYCDKKVSQPQQERLQTEMQRDFDRLWERNLGRDDRIMSSFGKEARFPFLDEALMFALSGIVSWVESKNSEDKQQHDEDDDVDDDQVVSQTDGAVNLFKDKNLLRFGAENILGIRREIAYKPKKAIQFGTKIANRKNKGEQVCL